MNRHGAAPHGHSDTAAEMLEPAVAVLAVVLRMTRAETGGVAADAARNE